MTVTIPRIKIRKWRSPSEVNMGGIIKHERRDNEVDKMLYWIGKIDYRFEFKIRGIYDQKYCYRVSSSFSSPQ
jgi:hypothetical protein